MNIPGDVRALHVDASQHLARLVAQAFAVDAGKVSHIRSEANACCDSSHTLVVTLVLPDPERQKTIDTSLSYQCWQRHATAAHAQLAEYPHANTFVFDDRMQPGL